MQAVYILGNNGLYMVGVFESRQRAMCTGGRGITYSWPAVHGACPVALSPVPLCQKLLVLNGLTVAPDTVLVAIGGDACGRAYTGT